MDRTPAAGVAMLVDDDADENFVNERLIRGAGIAAEVIAFENPVEALAHLERDDRAPVDLMMVDINMPELSGFEVLDRHRALPDEKKARKVIMLLTSSLNPVDIERARNYPEIVYTNKPLAVETVFQILKGQGEM